LKILRWRPPGGDFPRSGAHALQQAALRCSKITS
jgi:hypothetical protein